MFRHSFAVTNLLAPSFPNTRNALRRLKILLGFRQADLAMLLNAGQQTVSYWLRGLGTPSSRPQAPRGTGVRLRQGGTEAGRGG